VQHIVEKNIKEKGFTSHIQSRMTLLIRNNSENQAHRINYIFTIVWL